MERLSSFSLLTTGIKVHTNTTHLVVPEVDRVGSEADVEVDVRLLSVKLQLLAGVHTVLSFESRITA